MTNALPLSSRIYGCLLVLYPEDLRRDHGPEMTLVFSEDLDAARREAGMRGVIRVWRCALGEFLRLALPGCASSPTLRVPAISFVLFLAMITAFSATSLQRASNASAFLRVARMALLLPLFSTPFLFLVSVWACRGRAVISLGSSINAREE
jgi:hypothetical protein